MKRMTGTLSIVILALGTVAVFSFFVDRRADLREAEAEARFGPLGEIMIVDDTPVHYVTKGEGRDLVLLHGASGNLREFTLGLVELLSREYRVTAFDRPGLGWTGSLEGYGGAWSASGESPREQARFLQRAADRLGLERPIVLGQSYGGAVALGWALERPEDTAALVLVAPVTHPWPGQLAAYYRVNGSKLGGAIVIPLIAAFVSEERVMKTIESIFAPQPVPPAYHLRIGVKLSLRRDSLRTNARQVNSLRPYLEEMAPKYDALTMPIEVLHGTEDKTVGLELHSAKLEGQLPSVRLERMAGVGHMPHHAEPEAVVKAIRRANERASER